MLQICQKRYHVKHDNIQSELVACAACHSTAKETLMTEVNNHPVKNKRQLVWLMLTDNWSSVSLFCQWLAAKIPSPVTQRHTVQYAFGLKFSTMDSSSFPLVIRLRWEPLRIQMLWTLDFLNTVISVVYLLSLALREGGLKDRRWPEEQHQSRPI